VGIEGEDKGARELQAGGHAGKGRFGKGRHGKFYRRNRRRHFPKWFRWDRRRGYPYGRRYGYGPYYGPYYRCGEGATWCRGQCVGDDIALEMGCPVP
jgi:hypothetical protein